jgi:hypothetical protein
MENEGRREEMMVSEVETDNEGRGSGDESGNDDDGIFLDLNPSSL